MLTTFSKLTQPHSIKLKKKNEHIHPFENAESLEFLAGKNECGMVVFGTHNKKRPNNITLVRMYDNKVLDLAELLLVTPPEALQEKQKMNIGVEMKPMMLFAGSQWEDESSSERAEVFRTLRSQLLDLFQGEEIPNVDVAGLQHVLMIAAGEAPSSRTMDNPADKPVLHLRWYKVNTKRSTSAKVPRVELEPVGPAFDFRVSRFRSADESVMKEAMKHGRRPNEARTKKNIETDLIGDKIGRVHLGKQDLSQLQTRKMKGLKRSHADLEDAATATNGDADEEDDLVSGDEEEFGEDGGMQLDMEDDSGGSESGGSGDEISIGDSDEEMEEPDAQPKRQKLS